MTMYGKHWKIINARGEYFGVWGSPQIGAGFKLGRAHAHRYDSEVETKGILQSTPPAEGARAVEEYPTFEYSLDDLHSVQELSRRFPGVDWEHSSSTPALDRARLVEIIDYFSAEGDFSVFWAVACLATPREEPEAELLAAERWLSAANDYLTTIELADSILSDLEAAEEPRE